MKPLTADKILEKTFHHLKVMLDENQEYRNRIKKRQSITNWHMCPKYQIEKQEFVVDQEISENN